MVHALTNVDLDAMTGTCGECGPGAPLKLVGKARQARCFRHYREGRDRINASRRARPPEVRERYNSYHREYNRHYTYSMEAGGLEALLERAGSKCQICRRELTLKTMRVDHDHSCCPGYKTCGACVRGALCQSCNSALGQFGDNTDVLMRAVEYLNSTP